MQELHRPIYQSQSLCKTFWLDTRAGWRVLSQKDLPGAMNTRGVEGEGRLRPLVRRCRAGSRTWDWGAAWLRFAACGVKRGRR